ncbi:MAG: hypothetical protein Q4D37_04125 [Oscillospiraceae bacterium]|nr:hypothetical protein [Oscillospiraceae bacterium]
MGLFGTTMGIMSGVARGTASASMWTGNMIYTALQNARTKKEIRALYKHASDANFQNRAVAILPGISKQQLLLTSGEPDDNDVYDYQSQSGTAALDYIWGETNTPGSVIVSGGQSKERVCALIPFVHKAQTENIPVIALHTGNADLEHMIQNHSRAVEFVSRKGFFYDVFRGMPVDDIAFLLYETMPSDTATPAAESLLRALIEVLLLTDGKITLHNLAAFPLITLKSKIDAMQKGGLLSDDEYDEINHYCMAGSSDTDAVRIFLNRLNRQSEAIYGKPLSNFSNIKRMLNQKGVVAIDVGSSGNELLVTLVLNHLLLLQGQGKEFAVLLDNIPISRHEKISDLLRGHPYAISSQDFISSLFGGGQRGDDLFSEITGNVNTTVLFRHASGTTCQKWSDHLGKYRKIRIRYNIAQNNAFMNTSNSRGLSVDEADEPRIRAETLGKLADGLACIHSIDGILIAEVKDS